MPVNIKNATGPHEGFFEINGDKGYQDLWAAWMKDGELAKKAWLTFWSFMSSTGLSAGMFESPNRLDSGKYEGVRAIHLTNEQIYKLWQNTETLTMQVELAWAQAMVQTNGLIDQRLGAQLNYSDASSLDRDEMLRAWPPPYVAIRPRDASASEIVLQAGKYALKETISATASGATQAAAAVGQAAGGAAAAAAGGVVKGVVSTAAKDGAKGVAGIAVGGTIIHRVVTGKWWWQ